MRGIVLAVTSVAANDRRLSVAKICLCCPGWSGPWVFDDMVSGCLVCVCSLLLRLRTNILSLFWWVCCRSTWSVGLSFLWSFWTRLGYSFLSGCILIIALRCPWVVPLYRCVVLVMSLFASGIFLIAYILFRCSHVYWCRLCVPGRLDDVLFGPGHGL